ncbi:uncharacterized protein VP01_5534g1 [Puccinia sorghi]|uniref:Uncharacterized protein n=1 Tax=Puccinia sorghi TaxID=27349 RepID=A0A0L6UJZ8_9BASI|nr:uncharacterized protein VP01_5534g1 [Puccinia sorghi]
MSWPCFLNLLNLIKPDPIFYNQSPLQKKHAQLPVVHMQHAPAKLSSKLHLSFLGVSACQLHTVEQVFLQFSESSTRCLHSTCIATCHLGSNVNGAAVLRLKKLFQVGYGKINLYTTQVIKAIYNMR